MTNMPNETAPKTFTEKLIQFQTNVSAVTKGKENPHFKSKYADINIYLAEIKPVLSECGLYLIQPIEIVDGNMVMRTIVTDGKDKIEAAMLIPQTVKVQDLGSSITYLRRYSIQSLLALEAEDDDANKANDNVKDNSLTEVRRKEIDAITDIESLREYYQKNKGKGKELDEYMTKKSKELSV